MDLRNCWPRIADRCMRPPFWPPAQQLDFEFDRRACAAGSNSDASLWTASDRKGAVVITRD